MIIRNKSEIATTKLRRQALNIIEAGIRRVLPDAIFKEALVYNGANQTLTIRGDVYDLSHSRLFVIGGGKASGLMAEALEAMVGSKSIVAGVVNCKGGNYQTEAVRVINASHPIPDERGIHGVEAMLALKETFDIEEGDVVLCLISGGGSALLPYPIDGVSLTSKQETTRLLISSGADISEINAVRKHLSGVKGGRLARYFFPATVVSLILSDVVGNDLSVIASGPTVPDPSTFEDAYHVLVKYDLLDKAPDDVVAYLRKGCRGEVAETPAALTHVHNYIVGDNGLCLEAMSQKAAELGFTPFIVTSKQQGETTYIANCRAEEILQGRYAGYDLILAGGETTLRIPPEAGQGGRNQHYAAASLLAMANYPGPWLVACIGTDGTDYLADTAGAVVDNSTYASIQSRGLNVKNYLDRYDSYTLFSTLGHSLIRTGETGTNVGDAVIYILK